MKATQKQINYLRYLSSRMVGKSWISEDILGEITQKECSVLIDCEKTILNSFKFGNDTLVDEYSHKALKVIDAVKARMSKNA